MKEYEIYVPVSYNDGSPVEDAKIDRIGERLLDQFGGVTFFPQPNRGTWKMGHVTFQDQIVIFRVISAKTTSARRFLKEFKEELKRDLRQEDIFIVVKEAEVL
ncbi:MAG: hypothetical protein ACJ8FY_17995 [Gemmataceae bacterium]